MMKSPPLTPVSTLIAPFAEGWRLTFSQGSAGSASADATFPTLHDVVLPTGGGSFTLALPARLAILERFTLPVVDRSELDGMVLLQLEKTLPYPVEETIYGFEILSQRAASGEGESATLPESTVIACAIHTPALDQLAAPFLSRQQYPARVSLWAMHLATQLPKECVVAAIWLEGEQGVFAIYEGGVLSFIEVMGSRDEVVASLPHLLMSAELAGASTEFAKVLLDPALAEHRDAVRSLGGCAVETLSLAGVGPEAAERAGVDLTPAPWRAEVAKQQRNKRLKRHALTAVAIYGALLLIGYAALGVAKIRLGAVEKELAAARPQMDALLADQARWRTMAPAIDERRFTLEVLLQIFESLPSQDVRVTLLEHTPTQFRVDVEAPSATQAIEFGEKLKARESLKEFSFDAAPPSILSNDKAQYRIFGKL